MGLFAVMVALWDGVIVFASSITRAPDTERRVDRLEEQVIDHAVQIKTLNGQIITVSGNRKAVEMIRQRMADMRLDIVRIDERTRRNDQ